MSDYYYRPANPKYRSRSYPPFVEVCSFMDPRFKSKYVTDEEHVKKRFLMMESKYTILSQNQLLLQQRKIRTLGSLLKQHECEEGSVTPTISPEQKIQSEVSKYIDEPRLDVEDDLLKWWKIHCELYPMLTGVARKYLCVPATSTVSERVFSKSGKIVTPARCALKPDKVVFLAKNVYRNS